MRKSETDRGHRIRVSDDIKTLKGVYNLPMIGREQLDIQDNVQKLTGRPRVKLYCPEGVFVQDANKQLYQLADNTSQYIPDGTYDKHWPMFNLPDDAVIVVRTDALRKFENKYNDDPSPILRTNVSDKLLILNKASTKFWDNADRDDRGTHTDNVVVAKWLEEQGFSRSLAEKGATIIRPKWALVGRKPEE